MAHRLDWVYRLLRSRVRGYRDAALWGDLRSLAPAVRHMAETGNGTDASYAVSWAVVGA